MKTPVYFVPGFAASTKIFQNIQLPSHCEAHFLDWIIPNSPKESIQEYAKRMSLLIKDSNPVLIGVSFGGIMAQEISKIIKVQKVIIISSIKNKHELPTHLKFVKNTKAYKLFPAKLIANTNDFSRFAIGEMAKSRAKLYKKYLSVRNETYLNWGVYQILHWEQNENICNIIHIQGTMDSVFPVQHITNYIPIEGGTHIMILNKARSINKLLAKILEE